MVQRCNINVERTLYLTLRFQRCIKVAITLIMIYIVCWTYYPTLRQRWPVLNLTSKYGRWRDVANLTSRFQRCCNSVVVTTSMVYSKLNLLSNVQATLELRWNVHVHGSTHQLHRKVFTLLCICLMVLGRWLILFNCELCK